MKRLATILAGLAVAATPASAIMMPTQPPNDNGWLTVYFQNIPKAIKFSQTTPPAPDPRTWYVQKNWDGVSVEGAVWYYLGDWRFFKRTYEKGLGQCFTPTAKFIREDTGQEVTTPMVPVAECVNEKPGQAASESHYGRFALVPPDKKPPWWDKSMPYLLQIGNGTEWVTIARLCFEQENCRVPESGPDPIVETEPKEKPEIPSPIDEILDAAQEDDLVYVDDDDVPLPVSPNKTVVAWDGPTCPDPQSIKPVIVAEKRGNKVAALSQFPRCRSFTSYAVQANLSGTSKSMKGACRWDTPGQIQCRTWLTEKGKWRLTWSANAEQVYARTVIVK